MAIKLIKVCVTRKKISARTSERAWPVGVEGGRLGDSLRNARATMGRLSGGLVAGVSALAALVAILALGILLGVLLGPSG